ncbi:hypothetical protein HAX54_044723 [Datura stramonium]|uniref:Uncharacterized protein n=1 Tax=Datura stramonium TaxID=4076 RepID=A0ABS8WGQ4_DATST|nr:hypothetical protein [Datura stramonium]
MSGSGYHTGTVHGFLESPAIHDWKGRNKTLWHVCTMIFCVSVYSDVTDACDRHITDGIIMIEISIGVARSKVAGEVELLPREVPLLRDRDNGEVTAVVRPKQCAASDNGNDDRGGTMRATGGLEGAPVGIEGGESPKRVTEMREKREMGGK